MDAALEWLRELHDLDSGDGAGDDPLGVALGAGPLDQKLCAEKAMGTASFFSKAGQGTGDFGADS